MAGESSRRGFLDSPRWMDGTPAGCATVVLAGAGVASAVGFVVVAVFGLTGRMSAGAYMSYSTILAISMIVHVILYRRVSGRAAFSDRPVGIVAERLFTVRLPAEGNWLKRVMEPARSGHLVIEDDYLRLLYRPGTQYVLGCIVALQFVASYIGTNWALAGLAALMIVFFWTAFRLRDIRIPWDRVRSAAVTGRRFHLETEVDWHPEGIVLEVLRADRKRLAALLAAKTKFEDLGAANQASVQPRDRSTMRR